MALARVDTPHSLIPASVFSLRAVLVLALVSGACVEGRAPEGQPSLTEASVGATSTLALSSTTLLPPGTTTTSQTTLASSECAMPPGDQGDDASSVTIYASCFGGPPLVSLVRDRPAYSDPIVAALAALVAGTTQEERDLGLIIGFDWVSSNVRARIDPRVELTADGVATIQFLIEDRPWNPEGLADTSTQLSAFVLPIVATLFEFQEVSTVDLGKLCWGEMGCETPPITRAEWERTVASWQTPTD